MKLAEIDLSTSSKNKSNPDVLSPQPEKIQEEKEKNEAAQKNIEEGFNDDESKPQIVEDVNPYRMVNIIVIVLGVILALALLEAMFMAQTSKGKAEVENEENKIRMLRQDYIVNGKRLTDSINEGTAQKLKELGLLEDHSQVIKDHIYGGAFERVRVEKKRKDNKIKVKKESVRERKVV